MGLIGFSILGIIIYIGLIRVIYSPYTGFMNLLMEISLLDFLLDAIIFVFENIGEIID